MNGAANTPDSASIPAGVYTVPALASLGLTEEQASGAAIKYTVKANDLSGWRASQTHAETVVYSKVLVETGSDRIAGAHVVGHGAEEIIHRFAFAVQHGLTTGDPSDTVHA